MDGCDATVGGALVGAAIVVVLVTSYLGLGGLIVRLSEPSDRPRLLLAWAAGVPFGAAALALGVAFVVNGLVAVFAGAALAALGGVGAAYRLPEHGSWKSPLLGILGGCAPSLVGVVLFVVALTMTDGCMFT